MCSLFTIKDGDLISNGGLNIKQRDVIGIFMDFHGEYWEYSQEYSQEFNQQEWG